MKKTLILLLLLVSTLSGCATNPVTGKNELSLISEAQEIGIGKQQYAPMLQSQGGDYVVDPGVDAYVNSVGQRLAAVSDRKLPYEFTVINNSVPNAWALPGGKIAINRGLLTELGSEAELAAVLGHEIVHAAAKHGAKGMQRGMLLQGAVMAATVVTRNERYSNLAQIGASVGAQLIGQKYGRDAEKESDYYGMSYMSRSGYNPQGAVDLQKTFVKLSKGRSQDWLSGLFSSHPPSQERVQLNIQTAAALPKSGESGQSRYRQKMARLIKTKPAYDAYDKAQKALSKGKTSEAKTLVRKAISIESREGHFYSLLGDIDQQGKQYKSARGHYDQAIKRNSRFFYYYLQRGLVNAQLNADSAAKRDLEKSVSLLPTANAYNALGNVSRGGRDYAQAKQYYAKAAGHGSPSGKAAFGSLVDLDLADNPGKYIKVRAGTNRSGKLVVEVSNATPRTVSDVVVRVQYVDASGKKRQAEQRLRGRLRSGQTQTVSFNASVHPKAAGQTRSAVVGARVVK